MGTVTSNGNRNGYGQGSGNGAGSTSRTDQAGSTVSQVDPQHVATQVNMNQTERVISLVGGGMVSMASVVLAIMQRRKATLGFALLGGELLRMGVSGNSRLYNVMGINRAITGISEKVSVPHEQGERVEAAVLINRTPEELYMFWRNVENLPRVMNHLESVTVQDERRSHWVAKAPIGARLEWDAEIINEVPNERIGWRSLPGSQIDNAGSVTFKGTPDNRQTLVTVTLKYDPPAGAVGAAVAKLLGADPHSQLENDLKQFRTLMEAETVG